MCLYILEWPPRLPRFTAKIRLVYLFKILPSHLPDSVHNIQDIMQCVKCAIKIKSNQVYKGSLQLAQYRFDLALIATVNFN